MGLSGERPRPKEEPHAQARKQRQPFRTVFAFDEGPTSRQAFSDQWSAEHHAKTVVGTAGRRDITVRVQVIRVDEDGTETVLSTLTEADHEEDQ